jgi:hypothetical protein
MSLLLLAEVIYAIICVCALVVNVVLLYVVAFAVSGRARALLTSRCLLQLAVADFLLAFCLPALTCSLEPRALPRRTVSASACDLLVAVLLISQFFRCLLLGFFSLTAIFTFQGHVLDLRNRKVTVIFALCWSLAATCTLSLITAGGRKSALCDPFAPFSEYFAYREAFTLVYAIVCYALPVSLLIWAVRVQWNRPDRLDEQQISVRQSLRLATQLLALHAICATPHLLCQLWFTFEPQFERPSSALTVFRVHRGQIDSLSDPLMIRLYSHWFTSCLLFIQSVIAPLLVYRLGRRFGYGPTDLLEAMAANAADLQVFWRQQQQKLTSARYDPLTLYDKIKTNVKKVVHV